MSTSVVPNGRFPRSRRWLTSPPRTRRKSKPPAQGDPGFIAAETSAALRLPLPRKTAVPRMRRKKTGASSPGREPLPEFQVLELRDRVPSVRPLLMVDSPSPFGGTNIDSTTTLARSTTLAGLGMPARTPARSFRAADTGAMLARVLLGAGTPPPAQPVPLASARSRTTSVCGEETFQLPDIVQNDTGALEQDGNTPPGPHGKGEHRRSRAASIAPPTLGITEEEYVGMKRQFESMDVDGTGDLTWSELQSMSAAIGIHVDYRTFKLMDKDRSGTVDFEEMLRMFYPRARKADLRWAAKHWGEPHEGRTKQEAEAEKKKVEWQDSFTEESLKEVRDIFSLYCTSTRDCHGTPLELGETDDERVDVELLAPSSEESRELRLTRGQLRRMLRHNPHIQGEDVDRVIEAHGRSKQGTLNLEEFAELISDTVHQTDGVGVPGGQRRHVNYSFVEPPPPMPEF
eukprot:Hpha_TRINITY_DN6455_c0_g1::TRINITY_DN6455_c0_g1_i1::g.167::m.167